MDLSRNSLISQVVNIIHSIGCTHPIRVAIDGVDTAGKTTFANELVEPLEKLGRDVIRASIDSFHNPGDIRYQQGKNSPQGYFFDSFNHDVVKEILLKPLGANGNLQYQTSYFDFRNNTKVDSPKHYALRNSILIFDGVFLLRPELVEFWEYKIFLDVDFDVVIERASHRDKFLLGSAENVKAQYQKRYIPGQRIYLTTCQPKKYADIIVNNNDLLNPYIMSCNPTPR